MQLQIYENESGEPNQNIQLDGNNNGSPGAIYQQTDHLVEGGNQSIQ